MEDNKFYSKSSENLYNLIISFNKMIMNDLSQQSIHEFKIINKGSLLNYCLPNLSVMKNIVKQ